MQASGVVLCYPYTLKPVQLNLEYRELASGTVLIALHGRLMLGPEGQELERVVNDLLAKGCRRKNEDSPDAPAEQYALIPLQRSPHHLTRAQSIATHSHQTVWRLPVL